MRGGGVFVRRVPGSVGSSLRRHRDRWSLGFLVLLPTAIFGLPALFGSLVLPGDDLFQNEPLRVLAGSVLRSGRLPAWDPLIWSGTPLLAGWNAGAMFPGTWLFAFLPAGFAWTANLVIAYGVCATGTYLLLRRIHLGAVSSLLGGLLFTYTGFMNGQIVHIGLIQGTAFIPWALIGVEIFAEGRAGWARSGGVALFGAAASLTVLAGDPRAPTNGAFIVAIWVVSRIVRRVGSLRRFLVDLVAGTGLGIALSAIQWVPGIGFLHSSQRATAAYSFFSAGSLDLKTLLSNLLVPFLIGGNGNFGLPVYTGSYNLPEVTIGAGLFAAAAVGAYLPALGTSVRTFVRDRRLGPGDGRPLGAAYALIVVGCVLALGAHSPLGPLLVHLPLFGGERLQNRNALIADLGLALLGSFLVEDLLDRTRARAAGRASTGVLAGWPSAILATLGPAGAVALIAVVYVAPVSAGHTLGVVGTRPALFSGLAPYLTPTLILATVLGGFVLLARRLSFSLRALGAVLFVLADLLTFLIAIGLAPVQTSAVGSSNPASTALIRLEGPNGRSAIYNVASEPFGSDPYAFEEVGVTDLNLLRGIPSVQGYGSIVNGAYEDATETHLFADLNVGALAGTTFDTLDLATLLTPPGYLAVTIPANAGVPVALDTNVFAKGPGVFSPPPDASGPYPLAPTQPATFWLAGPITVDHVSLVLNDQSGGPKRVTVDAVPVHGAAVARSTRVVRGNATVAFPPGTEAESFVVHAEGGVPTEIGAVVAVTSRPQTRLLLDGSLQDTLTTPHWSYAGQIGVLSAFTNHRARGLAWIERPAGATGTGAPGTVRVLSTSATAPTVMAVDAPRGGVLVRSVEYAHGWTARLRPVNGGPTKVVAAEPDGLIQQVTLPPGKYIVTWRYAPTSILVGLVLTALGGAIFLALCVVSLLRRRGRGAGATWGRSPRGDPVHP